MSDLEDEDMIKEIQEGLKKLYQQKESFQFILPLLKKKSEQLAPNEIEELEKNELEVDTEIVVLEAVLEGYKESLANMQKAKQETSAVIKKLLQSALPNKPSSDSV